MRVETQRRVVEAITLVRVPLAIALPVLPTGLRGPVFTVAAATDLIDGRLARAWDVASSRGAGLDSFADAVLAVGTGAASLGTIDPTDRRAVAAGAGVVVVIRAAALLATRRRFGRWSIAHTPANKASGVLVGLVAARALFVGRLSMPGLAVAGVVASVAAVEELAIAVRADRFDPDALGFRRRRA